MHQYDFIIVLDLPEVNPIHQAVLADGCTSTDEWLDIVAKCQEHGYEEAGIEVLAAITVLNAIKSAQQEQSEHSLSGGGEGLWSGFDVRRLVYISQRF